VGQNHADNFCPKSNTFFLVSIDYQTFIMKIINFDDFKLVLRLLKKGYFLRKHSVKAGGGGSYP